MQADKQPPKQDKEDVPTKCFRKSSTDSQCDICYEPYHILGKWPMIACPNQHFFCDHCVQGLLALNNQEPVPCPICRALIRKALIKPHVAVFRRLNSQGTVKNALREQNNQLFLYAFQYEIFEIASLFKENKIDQLSRIERLELSKRNINKIQHLSMLTNLNSIHLENNLLQSVKGLEGLHNLKILNLNHNQLVGIDGLQALPKLENLAVEFNRIANVNLFGLSKLKHLFLFGNQLKASFVDELLMIEFPKLVTLSFSIKDPIAQYLHRNFLESLPICETLPSLKKLIIEELFSHADRQELQRQARTTNGLVELVWLGEGVSLAVHQKWLEEFYNQRHHYGETFKFIVDQESPHMEDYQLSGSRRVVKRSGNFTSLNCAFPIPKEGKQSFKFRIIEPSQHFFVGLTNAFLRYNANIYSEHFVGLTFWGTIYVRGDCVPVTGKVRYEEKPTIRITVDFEEQSIKWYSDEQLIGFVPLPSQFKHSELYFLFGMRDADTSIQLLE